MTSLREKKSFSSLFPTPEYLLLSSGGIAITDESVKFVRFKRTLFGGHLVLSHYEKFPLPPGAVQSGYINDAPKVTQVLTELSRKYGVSYARATLPEERAYLFSAFIDRVPPDGLRDAVAFIVEENVPVQLANSVFDFDVVEDNPASPKIKVTVSVLSKKVVDFYSQVFASAGITPVSYDIESQAIARAIVPKGDKSTQMIINLTPSKTGFYVVEDEVVQFTTTLPVGREEPPYPHLSDLVTEMRKIFGFWSARTIAQSSDVRKIDKVFLCGANATNSAFVTELMRECPVSFSLANPWINLSSKFSDLARDEISQEALDYASAIGLALPHSSKIYV